MLGAFSHQSGVRICDDKNLHVPSSGPPTRLSNQSVDARCHQSLLLISLVGRSSDVLVVVGLSTRCKDISRAIATEQLCRNL